MFRYGTLLACCASLLFASDVNAQGGVPQVVQLPTFSFFSVSTTVSVPDSGAAYLGGVKRRSASRMSRGVPGLSSLPYAGRLSRNDGIGSSASSSGSYVTANVIDHGELDRMILEEAAASRAPAREMTPIEKKAAFLSQHIGRRDHLVLAMSREAKPAAATHRAAPVDPAIARQQAATEVAAYLDRARRAEAAGNVGAARCSYRVVARRGGPAEKRIALARLAALDVVDTGVSLASSDR